ncbi:MAG TPA: hypothetical protein VGQ18_05180 [Gemmatimonadales bacterium]|jgi:hypothetical protein|nr:hypothetical protein [Gemmatimonadales bacterium]
MPPQVTLTFTALPHGFAEPGKVLRISVHVAPRLEGVGPSATLNDFKSYFADWPAIVSAMTFEVQFNPGPKVAATLAVTPDSAAWAALFPPDTPVKSFQPSDLPDQPIFSYPVANVQAHLKGIYQTYAQNSPDKFPARTALRADGALVALAASTMAKNPTEARRIMSAIRPSGAQLAELRVPTDQELRAQLLGRMQSPRRQTTGAVPAAAIPKGKAVPPAAPNPLLDFYQVANFFAPHSAPKPPKKGNSKYGGPGGAGGTFAPEYARAAAITVPEFDFHQMVASLGHYPALQVALGLVIELNVDIVATMVGVDADPHRPTMAIVPSFSGMPTFAPVIVRPKTAYTYQGTSFVAKPGATAPELTSQGLLRLQDKTADGRNVYQLLQTDVDGAALKAMNFSYGLLRGILHRSADSALDSSLPSLRSAGLALVRTGAAYRLVGKLQTAALRNAALPVDKEPPVFAEDLLRGYRVDVWDSVSKTWRSLHERHGSYAIDSAPTLPFDDEGYTQLGVSGAADGSTNDKKLHEVFARWEGWSLSVPRPGSWLSNEFSPVRDRPRAESPSGKRPLRMEATFTPLKGRLPRLRFGVGYRLRVRGVDVAGNSPALDALDPNDFSAATPEEPYYRFEPLPPPVAVLRDLLTDHAGESLERLVIRSFNATPGQDGVATDQVSDRHLAPPRGAWDLCDAHGQFDLPPADASDPTKVAAIRAVIAAHEGSFPTTKPMNTLPPPPADASVIPPSLPAGTVDPIVTSDKIDPLPYLPDPIGRGATLLNLPGVPLGKHHRMAPNGTVGVSDLPPDDSAIGIARVDFKPGGTWYDLGSFRVHLVDGTTQADQRPKWDAGQRVLTVFLKKAEVTEVRYSTFPGEVEDDLRLLGMWRWIEQSAPKNLARLKRLALDGRHWMISPFRTLTLVHAVQQPLAPPKFVTLAAAKLLGKTYATLEDHVAVHAKSTSKIDVEGHWSAWIDPLSENGPRRITGAAHVCEIAVDTPAQTSVTLHHRHDFGDTKYRRVRYRATATTRFREYLPLALLADEHNITRATTDAAEETTYKDVEVDVRSSARPEAPKVLYVLPAFEWQDQAMPAGAGVARRRVGGWLRVYLDRPWYSSGDGELLGVLFWNDTFANIPKEYRSYVTQWGNDPVWTGAPASGKPVEANFRAATRTQYKVTLEELTPVPKVSLGPPAPPKFDVQDAVPKSQTQGGGGLQIAATPVAQIATPGGTPGMQGQVALVQGSSVPGLAVAGHEPQYDADRQLWYVDLHVDAGFAYYPFVRLGLVRYQPNSVDNAHVSRVVVTDFAQLAPDRVANLSFDDSKPKEVTLGVYGRRYTESTAGDAPALQVHVESLRDDVPEELGWVPVPAAKVETRRPPQGRGLPALWYGTITLPTPRGSKRYRIVVREYEVLPSDAHPQRRRGFTIAELQAVGARVVYADAVEV